MSNIYCLVPTEFYFIVFPLWSYVDILLKQEREKAELTSWFWVSSHKNSSHHSLSIYYEPGSLLRDLQTVLHLTLTKIHRGPPL